MVSLSLYKHRDASSYFFNVLYSTTIVNVIASIILTGLFHIEGFAAIPYINLCTTFTVFIVQAAYYKHIKCIVYGPLGFVYIINFLFVLLDMILGVLYQNSAIHIFA